MARIAAAFPALLGTLGTACSIGALDGFSGAPSEADAGPIEAGTPQDIYVR